MLYTEITEKIINSFYKVHNTLGYGFLEKVYENALVIELKGAELNVLQQQNIKVFYKNQVVGNYCADLIVNDLIILEVKAAEFKRVIFTNDRKDFTEIQTTNPCTSVQSVKSVFPSH